MSLEFIIFRMQAQSDKVKKIIEQCHTLKIVDGKFSIKDKKLGEGSFAKTYLTINTETSKVVACKMIEKKNLLEKINLSKNKTLTKQYFIYALKNEVKTWKSVHHENIVEFIDFSETQNNIYFFLEYCSGGHLESYLIKNGPLQEKEAVPLILQLVKGCAYLFDKGIYHRDLKTQNILISNATKSLTLKLSDFGFAKMVAQQESKNNPTAQTAVGTPIYMSPQVIMGDPYTIKCDVWSLGVVFYKMLFNLFPWEKTEHFVILVERMKKKIEFPPYVQISNWLKNLLMSMLTVEEEKRISIKQVLKIIQKEMNDMEVE